LQTSIVPFYGRTTQISRRCKRSAILVMSERTLPNVKGKPQPTFVSKITQK
jgi:hypothetical protein